MKIGSWAYIAKKFIFLQTVLFYALTLKVLQNKSFCYILVYSYFPSTETFSVITILLTMAKHRQIIDFW